jgi:hypothetical protein
LFVSSRPTPPGLAETFGLIIGGLCKAAAVRMCADPSVRPPLLLIHAWLKRLVQKFAALVARAEAGTLRPPRPGRQRAPAKNPPGKPRPRWPTNFAWLIKMLPYEAACFGSLRLPPRPPRPPKPNPPKQPRPERTCDVAPANGRKPRHPPSRGADGTVYVWRRWRDIWMPEPVRTPKPA